MLFPFCEMLYLKNLEIWKTTILQFRRPTWLTHKRPKFAKKNATQCEIKHELVSYALHLHVHCKNVGKTNLTLTWINIFTLTLTLLSPTKSDKIKGKWRKCAKSHYVIEAGIVWARNHCPGSDSWAACQGWTVHCGARDPRFVSGGGGEPHFWIPPFPRR